jgi:hypothetical protein
LLETALNKVEMEFLERHLSEEQLAMAKLGMLQLESERPPEGGLSFT